MTEDRPFDAGDADLVGKRNRGLKRAAASTENTIRAMLATPEARAYLWGYLGECGIFASSCPVSSGQLYFNEGQRNAGLRLLGDIPADLQAMMANEAKAEKPDA